MSYSIQRALPEQVEALCAIEREAMELFRGHRAWRFYAPVVMPPDLLRLAIERGLVWVALSDASGEPVGFVWLDTEDEAGIGLAEIDVLPDWGGQGIGAALLEHACAWARAAGYRRITLGTLADVPWNAPFYARHGFVEVDKRDPAFAFARERDLEQLLVGAGDADRDRLGLVLDRVDRTRELLDRLRERGGEVLHDRARRAHLPKSIWYASSGTTPIA